MRMMKRIALVLFPVIILLNNNLHASKDSSFSVSGITYLQDCLTECLSGLSGIVSLHLVLPETYHIDEVEVSRSTEGGVISFYINSNTDTVLIESVDFGETGRWNSYKIFDGRKEMVLFLRVHTEYQSPIYWDSSGQIKKQEIFLLMMISREDGISIIKEGETFKELQIINRAEFLKRLKLLSDE